MPGTEARPKVMSWASVIEPATLDQAEKAARLPFVPNHVALMPDAHVGIGATVGSVIPTENAIIPAAVGVDIGCGMIASRTNLTAKDLPDSLDGLMPSIERAVPAGVGKGHEYAVAGGTYAKLGTPSTALDSKLATTAATQFGTLGSGNHFVEVCLDGGDNVWAVLHSGSRGIGNKLATRHISEAKGLMKALNERLEDPDLAYFIEGTDAFQNYIDDMLWSQAYAMASRQVMMGRTMKALFDFVGHGHILDTINCHHNFTQREVHNGNSVWITRKGAIKADVGDRGVIPGSMGTRSYIIKGKGNPLSYNSCSHGAGRMMSRGHAKRVLTAESLTKAMSGKSWNSDRASSLVDEHPRAYKDIDQVMADQEDLVEVEAVLRQVFNYKG